AARRVSAAARTSSPISQCPVWYPSATGLPSSLRRPPWVLTMTYCGPPNDAGLQPMPTFCVRPNRLPLGSSRSMSGVSGSRPAGHVDERGTGPALEDRPVGLPEAPRVVPLDTQGLKHLGRHPRQFRAGVHQHRFEGAPLARAGGVLDLDVYAERSHIVPHNSS